MNACRASVSSHGERTTGGAPAGCTYCIDAHWDDPLSLMCPNRRSGAKKSQLCAGEPSHCLVRRTPPASALTHKPPKAFHWTSASENLWLAWSAHAWVDTGASPESAGPPESRHAVTPLAADLKRPSREVGSLTHWSAPLPRQNPILAADTDWPGPLDTHIPRKPTREPSGLRPYHACSPVTHPWLNPYPARPRRIRSRSTSLARRRSRAAR